MNERRNSNPILLPAGRKWKALFGFLGFSGLTTVVTLFVGGIKAWDKWDTIQRQQVILIERTSDLRGRVAELTTAENDTRAHLGLPPIVHQSILDGQPVVYVLPRKPTLHSEK